MCKDSNSLLKAFKLQEQFCHQQNHNRWTSINFNCTTENKMAPYFLNIQSNLTCPLNSLLSKNGIGRFYISWFIIISEEREELSFIPQNNKYNLVICRVYGICLGYKTQSLFASNAPQIWLVNMSYSCDHYRSAMELPRTQNGRILDSVNFLSM